MLFIIASTGDELHIDDLEWPWTPKIGIFSEFFAISGWHTFQKWIALKWLEIDQNNLHKKFSALNVDFISLSADPLGLRRPAHTSVKEGYPSRSRYLSAVCLSNVKMVANKHRHAAYHNKHWRRASHECQHQWPWMTLNHKNKGFYWFFGDFLLQKTELGQNRWR